MLGHWPTAESKNNAGSLITRERTCLKHCYRAAQAPEGSWLISGAPPARPAKKNGVIHLQQVAAFTSFLVLEKWACMQIEKKVRQPA